MNRVSIYALVAVLLCSTMMKTQTAKRLDITVQVLDGRNGKPLADQHVLVFTGLSAAAAGLILAYNPKTDTGCYGLAVGAMAPAGGRAAAVGPLSVGNLGNADNILAGGSVFAGAQSPNPFVGVQAMGNSSGLLAGGTSGSPGRRSRRLGFQV